ncbi:MAG: CoA transferase [Micromonosporaceae bacterium]|nr:CoA transferase [Micromonosporaceae bacterium]
MGDPGPLAGVRVLDAATVLAGPLAAQLLGDYGAEVVKIEHPARPDSMRTHGPAKDGVGLWWSMIGRNKRCIGLHLGVPEGQEIFRRLAGAADVVVENFRPGVLERWGLGYQQLRQINPGLVLLRVTGFGQTGPYAQRPGFGTLAEALSGFAAITGEPDGPPTLPPFGLADSIAGVTGFGAVLTALYSRATRGGEGQEIDLNILAPLVTALGPQPTVYDQLGTVPQRTGNRSGNNAPRNTYRTADGQWVAVSTSANSVAERLLRLVGHPEVTEAPWFGSGAGRAAHADLLDDYVAGWVGARTRDQVQAAFEAADVAVAPVYTVADLLADPHVTETELVTTVADPALGPVRMQNLLFGLSGTPGRIRFTGRPAYADTGEVLGELGIGPERVARLRERGVVA